MSAADLPTRISRPVFDVKLLYGSRGPVGGGPFSFFGPRGGRSGGSSRTPRSFARSIAVSKSSDANNEHSRSSDARSSSTARKLASCSIRSSSSSTFFCCDFFAIFFTARSLRRAASRFKPATSTVVISRQSSNVVFVCIRHGPARSAGLHVRTTRGATRRCTATHTIIRKTCVADDIGGFSENTGVTKLNYNSSTKAFPPFLPRSS